GEEILRALLAVAELDRARIHQLAEPRGQHGPRDARDAALHLAEAPAPAEELPHDEKRPPLAEKIQRARNRAELTVALHVPDDTAPRFSRWCGFRTAPREGAAVASRQQIIHRGRNGRHRRRGHEEGRDGEGA